MVLMFVFVLLSFILHGGTTPRSGPYYAYTRSVKPCQKPSYPLHPNPSITVDLQVYNSTEGSGLRGNFTVHSYATGIKMKTKSLIWDNGKWTTNFVVMDNTCRGSLMPLWMSLFKIKFDRKKCAFLPSRVSFDVANTNKLNHILTKTAEYGQVMFVQEMIQVGKQYKTICCHEFNVIIEPI